MTNYLYLLPVTLYYLSSMGVLMKGQFVRLMSLLVLLCAMVSAVSAVTITTHPERMYKGDYLYMDIVGLQNGQNFTFVIDSTFATMKNTSFTYDTMNFTMPFSLDSGVISTTISPVGYATLIVKKGDTVVTKAGNAQNGTFSATISNPVASGTYDYISLGGYALENEVRTHLQLSGIKQGPDNSSIMFRFNGVETGSVRIKAIVDGQTVLPEKTIYFSTITPAPVLTVGNGTVTREQTVPVLVFLDTTPTGLASYNTTVSLGLGSPGEVSITGISFPAGATGVFNSTLPASSVTFGANLASAAGSGNVTLATLQVRGTKTGTASLIPHVIRMNDSLNWPVGPVVKSGLINVTEPVVPPVAQFTAAPLSGDAPLNVTFTDQSLYSPSGWLWEFGDNATSSVQSPMHLYSLPGLYTVNLTVTKGLLSNKTTKINYINVTKPVPVGPTANFTANTTCGVRDVTVAFTDSSTGSPDSWLWSFGDNTTSTVQSPAHTYTSAGSYTVSLRVAKSGDGNDTRTMPGYVTVYNPVSMTTSANVTSGQAPLTVRFDTVVTGGPGVWTFSWAFGDGTNSTEQSPVHVYQKQGSYPACVTGTTTVCGQTLVRNSCVDIAVGPSGPTGSLRVTSLPGNATVFIDGVEKGYTPVTITGIPAGSCHLKVSKSGYQSFDKTVNIKPDKTSTQMVFMRNTIGKVILKPLAPSKGSISVVTFPNSTVYLNNVEKGTSPLTIKDLAPGVYSVKVSLAGYPEHTIPVVRVMRGFTTPVNWYFVNSLPNATPTPGTPPGFGA